MIKDNTPISMPESLEFAEKTAELDMPAFIKHFTKIKPEKAKEFRRDLEKISPMKINAKHISKVIDLLPNDNESLNKIFTDINLDEDETKKIFASIKQYK